MMPAMNLEVARRVKEYRTTRLSDDARAYARWEYNGSAQYILGRMARESEARTTQVGWTARVKGVLAQVSEAVANAFSTPSGSG